jgi:hypothetical protein
LHAAFVLAGLGTPSMRMQTFIDGGSECTDFLRAVAELVTSMVPTMEQLGLATAAEVEAATLAERLSRGRGERQRDRRSLGDRSVVARVVGDRASKAE